MPTVKFVKENKEVEVADGTTIRQAAKEAGINTNAGFNGIGAGLNKVFNCHGFGMCGTCRVNVISGMQNTNAMTMREKAKFKSPIPIPPDPVAALVALGYIGNEATMRLACVTQVHGDVEVETSPETNLFGENFFS
ncbi:MAG: (2Fe-2S)-binding protein [Planctomycetales bacterium]|nr:(2Fe-2S)-binding protein [Planctomycetales bacterium]